MLVGQIEIDFYSTSIKMKKVKYSVYYRLCCCLKYIFGECDFHWTVSLQTEVPTCGLNGMDPRDPLLGLHVLGTKLQAFISPPNLKFSCENPSLSGLSFLSQATPMFNPLGLLQWVWVICCFSPLQESRKRIIFHN